MVEADKTNPGLNPADPFFEQGMINLEGLDLEMELASFLGEDNGWDASNILDNIGSPSSFNSWPYADFHEPNSTTEEQQQKDLDSSTFKTFPTNENTELIKIDDPNLNGSIIATQNQVQTTTVEPAYNKENSSNCENPIVAPTPIGDDPSTLPHQQSFPNCSAPLLNETPPTHSSPSPVGLISEIAGSSIQDKDMAHMGCFCQFSHMQNENSNMHGVLGMPNQQSISNNPLLTSNIIMGSNNFSGINHHNHPPPYPALCYIYPIKAGVGIGNGTGHSSGQFITNQRPALQNNIIPYTWQISGRPGNNQFSTPNVYGSHYAPNYMQHESSTSYRQPNAFTPLLLHQDGHGIGMQKIFDLQSQNYLQAAYPTYPKPEQQVHHLHPGSVQVAPNNHSHNLHGYNSRPNAFVIVPPPNNPHAHQHAYNNRPMLPDPAIPSVPPVYSNYHPQSIPHPVTYNLFGTGSSIMQPPTTYPERYDKKNNNHYNPQAATMSGGHWQQGVGSLQLKVSQGVPVQMNDYNRLLNTPNNVQRQRHPLLYKATDPPTGHSSVPQAVCSRNLQGQQGGTTRTPVPVPDEGSSSQGSNSSPPHQYARLISLLRPEKESGVHKEQVTPISTNYVVTNNQRDKGKGKLPESYSTSKQPSEAIRRILDMNPRRTVTPNPQQNQTHQNNLSSGRMGEWIADLKMQLTSKGPIAAAPLKLTEVVAGQEQNEKPRRGRPPKRRGPIELSSSSKLQIRKSGSPPPEAYETPQNVQNEVQSANPTGPLPSASSELSNGIYDLAYAKIGLPVDPFLRFQAFLGK